MDDKYRMKTIAIGMAEMLKSQKADYICIQFKKIAKEWVLEGKLVAATTDGAFNMRKSTKAVGGLLKKCQEIVRFFKSCSAARKALDAERTRVGKKVYKFFTATETRWNSRLTLMRRVHELAGEMVGALEVVIASSVQTEVDRATNMKAGLLSEQERRDLKDLCNLLTPAAKLTHEIGGSKYPTISSAYPKIYGLLPALTSFTTGPAQEIGFRFTVDEMPDVTFVSMFLNPGCFDFELFHRDSNFLAEAKKLAEDALLKMAKVFLPPLVVDDDPLDDVDSADELLEEKPEDVVSHEINRYCETMLKDPKKRFKYLDTPQEFWMSKEKILPLLVSCSVRTIL
ncbi:hypothetical protein BGX33_001604 [Mortierella sp. NVP41]|nr:hypothetical protein BGX33_001604 [Mortierella sp. NVP41]